MDEEIDRLVVSVRADTRGFARDVAEIRGSLDGTLAQGAVAAGRGIENALLRAVRTGQLGFDDLRRVALNALGDIANSALRSGINALVGNSGGLGGAIASLFGAPGRATGGPVSPGRAYVVGERGPELFVPTSAGQIAPAGVSGRALGGPTPSGQSAANGAGGARDVRVAITINASGAEGASALAQSSRQVARAVKAAIDGAQG